MRRLREVSASILKARFSLSAVSSSTELDAVFTSTPSLRSRSTTSWLERLRSLASWKTLTFVIRRSPFGRLDRRNALALALDGLVGRRPGGFRVLLLDGLVRRRFLDRRLRG